MRFKFSIRSACASIACCAVVAAIFTPSFRGRLREKWRAAHIQSVRKAGADVYFSDSHGLAVVLPSGLPPREFAGVVREPEVEVLQCITSRCDLQAAIESAIKIDTLVYVDLGYLDVRPELVTNLTESRPYCTVVHRQAVVAPNSIKRELGPEISHIGFPHYLRSRELLERAK